MRAVDAEELMRFPYSEVAGTEEKIEEWVQGCGFYDEEAEKARRLCWKVIEGFVNVIKSEPTIPQPSNEPLTGWVSVEERLRNAGGGVSMERLTIRKTDPEFAFLKRGMDGISVGQAIDRLAAYEDTGLEPEEVLPKEYAGEIMRSMILLKEYQDIGPIDRLRELAQADSEGRCVMLPFKPPRWVYVCSARFPKPAQAHYASAINVLQDMEKGCVFGDTPEEAEAALRREQEGTA